MEGFVYILQSLKNNSFYIGSTIDVEDRFRDHNGGKVKSTKFLTPWRLMFFKKYSTIRQARRIEYKLKNLKSRTIIEQIIKDKEIHMGL